MSKKVKKAIEEKVVKPQINKLAREQTGKVVKTYYEPENSKSEIFNKPRADVKIIDDKSNEESLLENVPILCNTMASNIDGRKIKKGDRVQITYYRNNDLFPRITARKYAEDKNRTKEMETKCGRYIADVYGYY